MYIISACLCGIDCKYSGGNNYNEKIERLVKEGKAVLVCPEQLGGLKTPRDPAEQRGEGLVITDKGVDVTKEYVKGAEETLKIAKMCGATKAILKSKSPSCGYGKIYDGNFNRTLIDGMGVAAKLLSENGIEVISSDDLETIDKL